MTFLNGNLSLRKWKRRFVSLSQHDNDAGRLDKTRGVSLPPDLEGGSRIHGEYPIDRQYSDGVTMSPLHDQELMPKESVKMPEPTLPMEMPVLLLVPPESNESSSNSSKIPSPESSGQILEAAMDPVQTLFTSGVAVRVKAGPNPAGKRKETLNKLEDKWALVQVTKSALDTSGAMQAIEAGLKSFVEDIPWLMKGLDEVARIHPVVTVAVLAFKAVYTMEMTRRENDKRIKSLYVEMKDMMMVLVQLRDVKDPHELGPDGTPIDARLQGIAHQTAADIKDCANSCDIYAKKRLVVKVLKGHIWESKLVGFIGVFTKRRAEFEEALTIHTARAVDKIQSSVYIMKTKLDSIDAKLAVFTEMFQKFVPPDELKVAERVKSKGDIKTIQKSDAILREINDFENGLDTRPGVNDRSVKRSAFTAKDLRNELQEDFELAIVKNLETSEGKFVLYQRQLKEELSRFIRDENDRLLVAVKEGPHDRIRNEDLRDIWKEMNWRRNVKAKLFVLTLRDHFRDELQDVKSPTEHGDESDDEKGTDDWAFEYLGLNWLQPIMEAFDEDGSGYVTVAELNRLTESKPLDLDWSLQHWIAYWAIGWEMSAKYYVERIESIFTAMFSMLPRLLPRNRYCADYYLDRVWPLAAELTLALRQRDLPDLDHKFRPYMMKEEERIRKNLEDIRYDIDALDTVYVVAGPGRIETHVLPLLFLLLKRDFQIFRLATKKVLNTEELWDCADSQIWVSSAMDFRVNDLVARFKQQQLDVAEQFKTISSELLYHIHDGATIWELSRLQEPPLVDLRPSPSPDWIDWSKDEFVDVDPETGALEDPDDSSDSSSIVNIDVGPEPAERVIKKLSAKYLNYKLNEKSPFDLATYDEPEYDEPTAADAEAAALLKAIFGQWNGYIYTDSEFPWQAMCSFNFYASPTQELPDAPESRGDAPLLLIEHGDKGDGVHPDVDYDVANTGNAAGSSANSAVTAADTYATELLPTNNIQSEDKSSHDAADEDSRDQNNDHDSIEESSRDATAKGHSPTDPLEHTSLPSRTLSVRSKSLHSLSPPLGHSQSMQSLTSPSVHSPSPPLIQPQSFPYICSSSPPSARSASVQRSLSPPDRSPSPPSVRSHSIHSDGRVVQNFEALGRNFEGTSYIVSGECYQDAEGVVRVDITMTFPETTFDPEYWSGHIDETGSFVGYRDWLPNPSQYRFENLFILRQIPAEVMSMRPSPSEFIDNQPRALWQFAINTTLYQVRKKWWSWSFFQARRINRQRYLRLNIATWTYGRQPVGEEVTEFLQRRKAILPADANLYRSLRDYSIDIMPNHFDVKCAGCDQPIGGQRIMCLDCRPPGARIRQTINFCDHLVCSEKTITPEEQSQLDPKRPHVPTHDIVKLRTVLHLKDMPAMERDAKNALQNSRDRFAEYYSNARAASVETVMDGEVARQDTSSEGSSHLDVAIPQESPDDEGDYVHEEAISEENVLDVTIHNEESMNGESNHVHEDTTERSVHLDVTVLDKELVLVEGVQVPGPPSPASIVSDPHSLSARILETELYKLRVKSPPQPFPPIPCYTCKRPVAQPCWYCITCPDVFLCDECEASHSLPCQYCNKPYVQPMNYFYGERPGDAFTCNSCTVAGVHLWNVSNEMHLFTHPLVRCKERIEDPEEPPPLTTDERLTALEERAKVIDNKLDKLHEHMDELFTRMEYRLLRSLFSGQVDDPEERNEAVVQS